VPSDLGRFVRENAFLVAAVALPMAVAGLFLVATAIPRWTVPLPQYDLVLRVERPYDERRSRVSVDVAVRDGHIEATARLARKEEYPDRWALFLFEHDTLRMREIPIEVPGDLRDNESRTIVVDALAGRRISTDPRAPDGYELSTRTSGGGGGLMGELFGMGRYRRAPALVNRGRVVPLELPAQFDASYGWPTRHIGWIVNGGPEPAASGARGR
jgi:hypothetical protein